MAISHIGLPVERIKQLELIAKAKGTTIPNLIGDYIRTEIAAGTIPADIPGIEVVKAPDSITIRAQGVSVVIPMGEGQTVADLLRTASEVSDPARKKRWLEGAAALSGVRVKRAGNGIKVISNTTGNEFPLSLSVATDVADQIERLG